MNMTRMMNKRSLFIFLAFALLASLSFLGWTKWEERSFISLHTFRTGNGWGYEIYLDDQRFIYQPVIPALDSMRPFPDEASARRTGILVLERLREGKNFSVSVEEIKELLRE